MKDDRNNDHGAQHDWVQKITPARLSVGRCGTRPLTRTWIKFRQDHALARDAIKSELTETFIKNYAGERNLPVVKTLAADREDFICFPPRGKRLSQEVIDELISVCPHGTDVQIVISDGLSALAVEKNVPDLLPMIEHGLKAQGLRLGLPVVVLLGRVAVADQIAHALGARLAINLIGERPGLSSHDGLSAYMTYNPGPNTISSDRTVVSNIHEGGTPPVEAGAYISRLVKSIFSHGVSGVELQKLA